MKKSIIIVCSLLVFVKVSGQELFVYSEPASNMPAKSMGLRVSNWLMNEGLSNTVNYHLIPEVMWGVNKNTMVHVETYISNRGSGVNFEGGALYLKYRFFSRDEVYKHFRLAGFGRISTNNAAIHQEEIETNAHNTGYELGIIGTQLLHKLALSSTISFEQALNNANGHDMPAGMSRNAINYSLSAGRLILPKDYKNYKQTNVNLMLEFIGQSIPEAGIMYLDIAPSIQFIFNSQTRLDIGYKKELYSNMIRTAPNGFLIRVEHLLFNVL